MNNVWTDQGIPSNAFSVSESYKYLNGEVQAQREGLVFWDLQELGLNGVAHLQTELVHSLRVR